MATTAADECEHGHTCRDECAVDEEGRTSCCGAFTSIFQDDGTEYCKCCYGSVTAGAETPRFTIGLDR